MMNISFLILRKFIERKFIILNILIINFFNFQSVHSGNLSKSFNEEEVINILSQISEFYKSFENFKIQFICLRKEPEIEKIEKKQGYLIIENDSKEATNNYILDINDTYTVTDGETKWTYIKSVNEVNISDYDSNDDDEKLISKIKNTLMYPTEWLKPVLHEEKNKIHIIELEPYEEANQINDRNIDDSENSEEAEIDRIILEIKKDTKEIIKWRIDMEDGIQYTYIIKKFVPNLKIGDNFFRFDPSNYDNIIINDLR
ncbi:MAG: outer membrane lipoprotein carrier protein LolA [Bacteroidetes bacterium]|nr:outer membrane lipoprotein carrier protein LolA [Bacteroidota bacterium]